MPGLHIHNLATVMAFGFCMGALKKNVGLIQSIVVLDGQTQWLG